MNFNLFFDNINKDLKGLYYTFLLLSTIFFVSGCSVTDNLQEGEYLLFRQNIKGNKKLPTEPLTEIYKQDPNRKILGTMPYLSIYYLGKKFYDSTEVLAEIEEVKEKFNQKIESAEKEKKKTRLEERKEKKLEKLNTKLEEGNWLMRAPGEPPTIYDSSLTNLAERQMDYFVSSKGFFQGSVTAKVDTNGKKVNVTYEVKEGPGYEVKSYDYKDIATPTIDSILKANQQASLIETGERYDEADLSAERERINELLKNSGYYDFSRQFIFFEVDTTQQKQSVHLDLVIEEPPKGSKHKRYEVSKVVFDADVTEPVSKKLDTAHYRGLDMLLYDKNYSQRILESKIKIAPGELYQLKDIQATQRHLASLDMFKFININYERNLKDTAENTLTAYIRTSPLKKYQITDEWGLTVATQAFIPGPFGNLTFKTRNIFGGFETFEINLKASIEGYSSFSDPDVILRTQEFTGNTALTFPEFLFPFSGVRRLFRDFSPRTKILSGATLIKRPEYDRLNIKNSYSYSWMSGQYTSYNLSLIDVNVINTLRRSEYFVDYLERLQGFGSNLIYSFNNSFVSNSNFSYTFNNNEFSINENSEYLKVYAETGGAIFNIPNLAPEDSIFGLKTYRYLKGFVDARKYIPVSRTSTFAIRLNVGAVFPYDEAGALPYEKYFFAGGSNSIRAWRPRRLGPGSFVQRDSITGEPVYNFEQPGELIIENNYEYRFNIFSFFDGAFFIDAGNVWSLREESANARPGSLFEVNEFYKQIAVGTGFGLRFNFSFLILRFDLGIKAYDPGRLPGEKFVLPELIRNPPFGVEDQIVINIGIGYPY